MHEVYLQIDIIVNRGYGGNSTPSQLACFCCCCYYACRRTLCNLGLVSLPQSPFHPVYRCDESSCYAPTIPKLTNPEMGRIRVIIISVDLIWPQESLHWLTLGSFTCIYDRTIPPIALELLHIRVLGGRLPARLIQHINQMINCWLLDVLCSWVRAQIVYSLSEAAVNGAHLWCSLSTRILF